jgi:hypothetical protein
MEMIVQMLRYKLSLMLPLLAILTACQQGSNTAQTQAGDDTPFSQLTLRPIGNCPELKTQIVGNWTEALISPYRYGGDSVFIIPVDSASDAISSAEPSPASPDQVSQTNLQEQGVDEADQVKADSNGYLYIAHQNFLVIEKAFPANAMAQLSALDLGGRITGLYLLEAESTVIALVNKQDYLFLSGSLAQVSTDSSAIVSTTEYDPAFDIVVVDISDKSAPSIKSRVRIDGSLVSSRLIDQRLHVLSNHPINPPTSIYSDQDLQALLTQYQQDYSQADEPAYELVAASIRVYLSSSIESMSVEDWLPKVSYPLSMDQNSTVVLTCDSIYTPTVNLANSGLMTLSSIDADATNLDQLGLLGNGWLSYSTVNDFFFAQSSGGWWWSRSQNQQSAIHHFSIGKQQPEYRASGLVDGYINDSFSMSYRDNYLRVATTTSGNGPTPGDQSSNHLYVLSDSSSGIMQTTGLVSNFAPGERIQSARFFQDKAFVVTFRQVDPLFAFDLSQADNPRIVSELKIPGFSRYIHAIDSNTLLTIGRDGDDLGLNEGISVKLFDVSDLTSMRLLSSYNPDVGNYSWSAANWDHHAFTYYAPLDLLSIPVSSFDRTNDVAFSGLIALDIDLINGQINELGRVNHDDLLAQTCSVQSSLCGLPSYYGSWLSQPNRSIIMQSGNENFLYSLSGIGLKATDLNDFSSNAGSLLLPALSGLENYYLY